jgi:predicted nucleic-acid-binding protein
MIGLDTNILLRLLVDDGSTDVGKARRWVAARAMGREEFFVDVVVLAEVVWVLESVFAYTRTEIAAALNALLNNIAYRVDGHAAALAALAMFHKGNFDFSDCLIIARGQQAGCSTTVTLDKGMRKLAGATTI